MNPVAYVGQGAIRFFTSCGRSCLFLYRSFVEGLTPPYYGREIGSQLMEIGFDSLPVIGLTALFTGAVLALQSYMGFSRFSAQSALPTIVVVAITRELGPVIAGLMFAGRVGATIAAEIGTMKVTEQIDALTTLATSPYKYLYWPRIFAGMVSLPLLVFLADIIGIMGGYLVSTYSLNFSGTQYLKMTMRYLMAEDVMSGLVKAMFFGMATALMGCFQGARSQGGAAGVGRATMNAVVVSSIAILCLNYALTTVFFHK